MKQTLNLIKFKTLEQVENNVILHCFNDSFSDYFIPLQLSTEQFNKKLFTENIDKSVSVAAFEEDKLIGFILHGAREIENKKTAYNAGTGVILEARGQALTRRMYDFIKPVLESKNFNEVVLEVIADNIPAITSYEKSGFRQIRDLNCFKGEVKLGEINSEVKLVIKSNSDAFQLGEITPTWQNSSETILNLGEETIQINAYFENEICGYCVVNSTNNRILQLAVKREMRNRRIGSTLLSYIGNFTSQPTSLINVDSNFDSVTSFLKNRNLTIFLKQKEMKLELA